MKYLDGFWRTKPDYTINYAKQSFEYVINEDSVVIVATSDYISNRGQTTNGTILEVTFRSTLPDVIKVRVEHNRGALSKGPFFTLNEDKAWKPVITENKDFITITSNKTVAKISKSGAFIVEYYYDGTLLTKNGWKTTAYIEESPELNARRQQGYPSDRFYMNNLSNDKAYVKEGLEVSVGEQLYGFGEKFTPFVKNGQTVNTWNSDGGTCSEQSYKSIPFYVSSRNYGVLVNHPENVVFEVASETVSKVEFAVQGQYLEYFVIGGSTIANVIETYTTLTGKPGLPPAYTFGLWLTTSFSTSYDEETCSSFIDEMERRQIPLEVFHFDCFWMKAFNWCDFTWDKDMFSDPPAMLKRLHDKHLEICVWINSYVGQRSPLFDEGLSNGYFIKQKDGSVFQADLWQPGLAIVDFTNPSAVAWYAGKLRKLCEMGVDSFKTDFGERIPTDVVYFDGSDPFKMHNYYSYMYNKIVYNVLEEYYGKDKACLFARSATVGGQQFPVHWGGDCFSNYGSMYETIRGALSLCLSGFGFTSHDISGFESTGTPDLYKRWVAFGLLSTHSRLHGNASYRVPWNFDEESCDVLRHFVRLKGKLMPYLFANAINTHETGIPMMRAMVIDYGFDPATLSLDRQYMLGDSLLVAPIFNEEGVVSFYLPAGKWTDIQTGEVLDGNKWYEKSYDYYGLPLFVKPNTIIVEGDFQRNFEYDYADNASVTIYQIEDGNTISTSVFSAEKMEVLSITATRNGKTVEVKATGNAGNIHVKSAEGLEILMK